MGVGEGAAVSFPVYLEIGSLRVHPHALFEGLAYLIGFRLYLGNRRRRGDVIDGRTRWSVMAGALVGALVGSHLLAWLEDPVALMHGADSTDYLGGKTIIGGLIGGTVGVELVKQHLGVQRRTGDLFAVPIAVGIAIGRVGCFLTGLDDRTFGTASSLPWAVDFGDGVTRHPVQLYETAVMAALAAILVWLERLPRRDGDLFRWFIVAYMAWRVAVDTIKPEARLILGLSTLQIAALVTALIYGWQLIREASRGGREPDRHAVSSRFRRG